MIFQFEEKPIYTRTAETKKYDAQYWINEAEKRAKKKKKNSNRGRNKKIIDTKKKKENLWRAVYTLIQELLAEKEWQTKIYLQLSMNYLFWRKEDKRKLILNKCSKNK